MARYGASYVRRFLVGRFGFTDLEWSKRPSRVLGIPFVDMKVSPTLHANENWTFLRDGGVPGCIPIVWKPGDNPEDHRVLLRGEDFAPMLKLWVEHERSKRV